MTIGKKHGILNRLSREREKEKLKEKLKVMFEKYTVIKAVISTKVLLRQLHKAKDLVNS